MSNWTGSWSFMNRFFIKNTAQILNTLFFLMLFDRFFSVHVQNGSYSMVDVLYMYTMAHTLSLSSVYTVCKDAFKDTKDLECISKKSYWQFFIFLYFLYFMLRFLNCINWGHSGENISVVSDYLHFLFFVIFDSFSMFCSFWNALEHFELNGMYGCSVSVLVFTFSQLHWMC